MQGDKYKDTSKQNILNHIMLKVVKSYFEHCRISDKGQVPILGQNAELTILATFEAKIAKICNFWTFRLVIQLIKQLFEVKR